MQNWPFIQKFGKLHILPNSLLLESLYNSNDFWFPVAVRVIESPLYTSFTSSRNEFWDYFLKLKIRISETRFRSLLWLYLPYKAICIPYMRIHGGGTVFYCISPCDFIETKSVGLEITAGHHCGGETFQSIFSRIGWKYSEKSLLHSDDRPLFEPCCMLVLIVHYATIVLYQL